ncbi:MAG: TolC family protein [Rickettsiales bacterium]
MLFNKPTSARRKPIASRSLMLLILLISAVADAEVPTTVVNLQQALAWTLARHPELQVFQHRAAAYQGFADEVGASPRPTVALEVEDFAGNDSRDGFDSAQTTLSVSWLIQGDRLTSRRNSALLSASQLELERQIAALDLSAQTARYFIQALVEQQRILLTEQAVAQAKRAVAAINKRVETGRSPNYDLLQAEVNLAQHELEAEDLEHEMDAILFRLAAQWGDGRERYRPVGDIYRLPAIGDVNHLFAELKNNPSLQLLANQQRIKESQINLARIEARPQWQMGLGLRRYEETDDYALVAGLSVPLGSDRSSTGRMEKLRAEQAQASAESTAIEQQLDTQLFVLLQEIKHSEHVIETLRQQIIPRLDRAQQEAGQAYQAGLLSYQQWLALQNQKLTAQQSLLDTFEKLHLQHIELQRLTGTSLTQ